MIDLRKTVPGLAGLRESQVSAIATRCRTKSFRDGEMLFMHGELCRDLGLLVSGRVKQYLVSPEGREVTLKVSRSPGEILGLAAAFTGRHLASAKATSDGTLYLLDTPTVHRVVRQDAEVGLRFLAMLGAQVNSTTALVEDLALRTSTMRLAKAIYELAKADGVPKGSEIQLRRNSLTEEELGSRIGAVRVHVSRCLHQLASTGVIRLDRKTIHITDLNLLRQFADVPDGGFGEERTLA